MSRCYMVMLMGVAALLTGGAASSTPAPWCTVPPLRVGGPDPAFSLQDMRYGSHVYAAFILSSSNPDHHEFMKLIKDVTQRVTEYGVSVAVIDEEGSAEERMLVSKYGEGPLPRLVIWHHMPQQWLAKPTLLTTTISDAETLAQRIEHSVAELPFDRDVVDGCPRRRLKQGVVHLIDDVEGL